MFRKYGLTPEESKPVVTAPAATTPRAWIDFMMRFELGLEPPDPGRALRSAVTIASAYVAGGLIPLAPYFVAPGRARRAGLPLSVVSTLLALLLFGYVKGRYTGTRPGRSAWQTTLIGGLAAAAAFLIARLVT